MNIVAVSLEAVHTHTHTHTHTLCLLEAKAGIFSYALLNMYPFERRYPAIFEGKNIFVDSSQQERMLQFLDAHPEAKESIINIHEEFMSKSSYKASYTLVTLFFKCENYYHRCPSNIGEFTKKAYRINSNTCTGYDHHWDINFHNIFIEIG